MEADDYGLNCTPTADCPFYPDRCYQDKHHLFYPESAYKTPTAKLFRSLAINIIYDMCRQKHREEHAQHRPPIMPSHETMATIIEQTKLSGEDRRHGRK